LFIHSPLTNDKGKKWFGCLLKRAYDLIAAGKPVESAVNQATNFANSEKSVNEAIGESNEEKNW
jgi:hypothetical protein